MAIKMFKNFYQNFVAVKNQNIANWPAHEYVTKLKPIVNN
jgi:hypothetical protein